MRKILSLNEMAEKEKKRKRIGGIFIIALLLLSSLGFALSGVGINSNKDPEEGFIYNGQYWVYTVGTQKYYFTNHPDELNLSMDELTKNLADFSNKQVYVDSEISGGLQEIYNTLGIYAGKINEACYGNCERDLPERECLPGEDIMLILREDENESIMEKENCVFIEGNLKTVDAFLYKVLGIN